jgi:hypothetical protein
MHAQRPAVVKALRDERELRVKDGAPDDDRLNEAIKAFQGQFKGA